MKFWRNANCYSVVLLLCWSIFIVTPVLAGSDEKNTNKEQDADPLSITLNLGMVIGTGEDNLDPNRSSRYLDGLGSPDGFVTRGIAFIFPEITYSFAGENGPKLRFDTKSATGGIGDFGLNLGLIYPTPLLGDVQLGVIYSPLQELWRNPYLLDGPRRETDVDRYGARAGISRIGSIPLGIDFVYLTEDVEDDDIGRLMPDLARDGNIYMVNLHYPVLRSKQYHLIPELKLSHGEMDGESSSYYAAELGLGGRYTMGRLTLLPGVSYQRAVYDKVDPVFGETRKSDTYGARLLLSYFAPFNLADWVVTTFLGYSAGDASIDFYDTQGVGGGVFLGYSL